MRTQGRAQLAVRSTNSRQYIHGGASWTVRWVHWSHLKPGLKTTAWSLAPSQLMWQAFSCRHFHTGSETEADSGKRGRKPDGPNTRSRRAHRSLPHPPRLSAESASSSGSSVPPNPPWGRYKPLATQEALGSSISCLLLPEAPPPSMSAMRSVWSPIAHPR